MRISPALRSGSMILLIGLAACRTPPAGFEIGRNGEAEASVSSGGKKFVAKAHAGRLTVNGLDRGTVAPGDWVTLDWSGEVRVNGVVRR